jgi:myo-inositol 2-dehydrogenase/D-chiro-inositol 1-dehydrogenase
LVEIVHRPKIQKGADFMKNKHRSKGKSVSRRDFLKGSTAATAALAVGFPYVISSPLRGAEAPGNKITIGCIGVGRMGLDDMREFMGFGDTQVVAVCDVDTKRVKNARKIVDDHYSKKTKDGTHKGCDIYTDFRELIARKDIDVVSVVTPDQWHALPAIVAARAGKDIFLQKPLTLTIPEGRVLSDTVDRYRRVLQVGSQQRSDSRFRFACELVRNGRIGKLHTVRVAFGLDPSTDPQPVMAVPENLDYKMWLGPAPWSAYTEKRVHPQNDYSRPGWLRISDYCCGMITGWGAHHMDIAQWGIGVEESGPMEIIAHQAEYPANGIWDVHGPHRIEYTYANGVKVFCTDNEQNKQGVVFEGTEGWVYVRRGAIDANPKSLLDTKIGPDEIHLYQSRSHKGNFLECIRTRSETVAPVEVGHRSCSACVLGYIAMKLKGRQLKWDPTQERFLNDDEANRMLFRPMSSPWTI